MVKDADAVFPRAQEDVLKCLVVQNPTIFKPEYIQI